MKQTTIQKKKQADTVKALVEMILRHTSLGREEQAEAAKDIADVILTSWDLTRSDLSFGDTWFTAATE